MRRKEKSEPLAASWPLEKRKAVRRASLAPSSVVPSYSMQNRRYLMTGAKDSAK